MSIPSPAPLAEEVLAEWVRQGRTDEAARRILERHGSELYGFISALARDTSRAEDAFSLFCENLCRGLGQFRFESSLRTWLYAVARNAVLTVLRSPHRFTGLSGANAEALAAPVRTATAPFLRSEARRGFQELRSELCDEDQTLLILRVDRNMAWSDIAEVLLSEAGSPPSRAEVTKKSASLRKRFERLVVQLRETARQRGLLDE